MEPTASSGGPHDSEFRSGFGRGYRPDQVRAVLATLTAEREAAAEREAHLAAVADELQSSLATLRRQVAALPPPAFEHLGKRARTLLDLVEEEAREVAAGGESAADAERDRARRLGRQELDRAAEAAERLRAEAERYVERVLDDAGKRAAVLRQAAEDDAARVREEAEREAAGVRERAAGILADFEKMRELQQRRAEQELAGREAAMTVRLRRLDQEVRRRLVAAEREHAEAEKTARHDTEDAAARAKALLTRATAQAERIRREGERFQRDHDKRRDDLRAYLRHVRLSLAALTASSIVNDYPDEPEDLEPGDGDTGR
ncbi:hypothetical protein AQ490_23525 [Wenjunlia vitaminophila]|uniref:Cellulose-binding protein n=1 Tax=Wenjunlia vitaminophila TaxID=76728 RepID=A0A0T6LSN3_WENVI|nr:hypothetical protein [Wenjunlia vitaminophila]KRV48834.1 hypothetical protein AQ490_23525 [Wenjunlia vitaminophila]